MRFCWLHRQTRDADDAINALVEAKLARATILDRADPPDVVALIDEHVLYRLIGSPEVMHEQLVHVADLAERPYVCVQVVPTHCRCNSRSRRRYQPSQQRRNA